MLELSRELGVRFEHFQSFAKSSFVLGSEAWEEYFSSVGEHANVHQSNSWGSEGCRRRGW